MHDPTTPEIEQVTGDARGRRTAGLVLVLIVVFIGVAIAKPWGSPPASTSQPPAPVGTLGAAVSPSPAPTGTAVSTPAAPTPAVATTDVFGIAVPPPATATWSAIRWQLALEAAALQHRADVLAEPAGRGDNGGP